MCIRDSPYPPGVARVVVIEDEEPIAAAVAARLRSEGFEVEVAADGPSGVALVERTHPDLVVLDLMLPGLDGWKVIEQARGEGIGTPIVVVSARGTEHDRIHALELGAGVIRTVHGVGYAAGDDELSAGNGRP